MSTTEIRSADMAILLAAIQSSNNILQVDAEKVAKQLGLRLSSIPPRFTEIRKRYNIHVKVVNAGSLQRKKANETRGPHVDAATDLGQAEKTETANGDECDEKRAALAYSHACSGPIPATDVPNFANENGNLLF